MRRLAEALADDVGRHESATADVCLAAGQRLVAMVLSDEAASRDCALDLLTADALVTYAFEAASNHPGELPVRASRAMADIASLGVLGASECLPSFGTPPRA
jgi:hypothetical protein